jgi:release factor glutamine methyltransferase
MKKGTTLRKEIDKIQNIPKQYQQGYTEFYKLKFHLTPDVLIPRPETELLVEEALRIQNEEFRMKKEKNISAFTVIDIGTGSGCIAVSIAKNSPQTRTFALDISPKALRVAEKNAAFHKVEKRILFLESDLLSALISNPSAKAPDIIVTNLPYIPSPKMMLIDPMVRDFEPTLALDGGIDGFELYRKLFTQMQLAEFYPKYFIAEIDETQGVLALSEVKKFFPKAEAQIKQDLTKRDRILYIKF